METSYRLPSQCRTIAYADASRALLFRQPAAAFRSCRQLLVIEAVLAREIDTVRVGRNSDCANPDV